jgi:predicted permease
MKWWRRIIFGREMERRLDTELRFHIDQEIEANIAAGMGEEDARKAAYALFGSMPAIKEDVRHTWGWSWIAGLAQDLRYAFRVFRQNRAFTIVSILLLGIGIGTTSAAFTLLNTVFWNPLPVRDPGKLRMISWTSPTLKYAGTLTYGTYERLSDLFPSSDFACSWHPRSYMSESGPVAFQFVTGNYFQLLGINPTIGRLIVPEDDQPSSPGAAVISHRLWRHAYGGRRDVLNSQIKIAGRSFAIIGVMAEGFAGLWPLEPQDVMLPFNAAQLLDSVVPPRNRRLWSCTEAIGRLPNGLSEEQLRTQAQPLLQEQFVVNPNRDSKDARVLVTDIRQFRGMTNLQQKSVQPLSLLLGAAGIILLLTCINIAGLLLARGRTRRAELATRLALGAPRVRVVRQLVTESLLLSAAGGVLGIVLAYGAAPLLPDFLGDLAGRSWLTPAMTPGVHLRPDARVLGLSVLLTLTTAILFGLAPALRTTRIDLMSAIRDRSDTNRAHLGRRTGKILVCLQVSLSMLLSLGAAVLSQTLINLQSVPMGFDPSGVLFVETDPSRNSQTFVQDTLQALQAVPGVTAAAVSQWPLYNNALPRLPVCVPQHGSGETGMDIEPVAPRFFETWGIRFLLGRDFEAKDAGRGAIVNETFARTFFPRESPIGQQIALGRCPGSARTIVGVVADHRDRQRVEITPMVYVPYAQRIAPTTFAVRTGGDPRLLIPAIRRLMQEKGVAVDGDVMTGTAYVAREWRQEKLLAELSLFFGTIAVFISWLGIYALLSYIVTGRRAEIGLRMALGAQPSQVLAIVLRESIAPIAAGILLGALASLAGTRWIQTILFGISSGDPLTLTVSAILLSICALIAALLPAWRASRIDPLRALRCD